MFNFRRICFASSRKFSIKNICRSISTIGINNYQQTLPVATDLLKSTIAQKFIDYRQYSIVNEENTINSLTFDKLCEETLESLTDYFEEIVENDTNFKEADVSYSSGVLTINLGKRYGTYVINKQTPNKQIWLSSPTSGPKRYDFNTKDETWIYKHTGETLHRLLQNEISQIIKVEVDFSSCLHSKL